MDSADLRDWMDSNPESLDSRTQPLLADVVGRAAPAEGLAAEVEASAAVDSVAAVAGAVAEAVEVLPAVVDQEDVAAAEDPDAVMARSSETAPDAGGKASTARRRSVSTTRLWTRGRSPSPGRMFRRRLTRVLAPRSRSADRCASRRFWRRTPTRSSSSTTTRRARAILTRTSPPFRRCSNARAIFPNRCRAGRSSFTIR